MMEEISTLEQLQNENRCSFCRSSLASIVEEGISYSKKELTDAVFFIIFKLSKKDQVLISKKGYIYTVKVNKRLLFTKVRLILICNSLNISYRIINITKDILEFKLSCYGSYIFINIIKVAPDF